MKLSAKFSNTCIILFLILQYLSATPLDDYVNKFDPHYEFKAINWTYKGDGFTMYCINMTSQQWLTSNDSSKSIWYHAVNIAVPDVIKVKDTAFMYIGYASNNPDYIPDMSIKDNFNWFVSLMAVSTGTISAVIRNIPNMPVVFNNDPSQKSRKEDAIISWTWKMFLTIKSDQPEWLLRLPMTKAVVRGFDTVATFGQNFGANITKFMICGESKRGWTTWTTAAVDKRVIAFAPIVMDLLNLSRNLMHHYQSLGGWTFAFQDYYDDNITEFFGTPGIDNMSAIIDPYVYMDRYASIPKYIITTSNDEFFIPDDSHYYFNDLPGEKYLRVLPNAEHELVSHRISLFFSMKAFYLSVLKNYTRPKITWDRNVTSTGGRITFYTDTKPLEINAYYADTLDGARRDFRAFVQDPNGPPGAKMIHPVVYYKDAVKNPSQGVYVAEYDTPIVGWRNFFIQATFQGVDDSVFEFTSENQIIPDKFPFPPCEPGECFGKLV